LRGKRNDDMVWLKHESMEVASEPCIDSDGFGRLAALKLGVYWIRRSLDIPRASHNDRGLSGIYIMQSPFG